MCISAAPSKESNVEWLVNGTANQAEALKSGDVLQSSVRRTRAAQKVVQTPTAGAAALSPTAPLAFPSISMAL